jgi:hypothetical protein
MDLKLNCNASGRSRRDRATLDGAEGVCALEKLNSIENNLKMRQK